MNDESVATFANLGLDPRLVKGLGELGYEAPTPIQQRTIPVLLAGRDAIGQAQTGTGKTAAFALPILQRLNIVRRVPQALILAPTRELAIQVAEAIHTYSKPLGEVAVIPIYGGAPIGAQLRRLQRGEHVVVGTPGRVIDHLDRGSLDLTHVKTIVLDEGDEMLRMGFIDDVEKILAAAPPERQIALFSATMPREIAAIADRHMHNPEHIQIEHRALAAPGVEQRFLNVSENQKLAVLMQLLEIEPAEAVLIFRRTKNGAAELAEKLEGRGFTAVALHGDMNQAAREAVVRRLRSGLIDIVVATDVAARGLDIEQISHVVNYDVPYDVEAYVHRIGRTGRAGRTGVATLFITPRERRMMREIEKFIGSSIKPMKIPTSADVAAHRVGLFKESVRKTIAEGELEMYVELVEQLVDEGPFDMADVAAAAAKLASYAKPVAKVEDIPYPEERSSAPAPRSFAPSSSAPRRRDDSPKFDRPASSPRGDRVFDEKPRIRIAMSVGRRDGIRPADIVGSIANEADIPGKEIGPIEIGEEKTIVGVPAEDAERIVKKVASAKFRGKKLDVHIADAAEIDAVSADKRPRFDGPPRRDYGDRAEKPSFRSDRPAREGDKPFRSDRPAREGDKPFRSARPAARDEKPFRSAARPAARDDKPYRPSTRPPSRDDKPFRSARPATPDERPYRSAPKLASRDEKPYRSSRPPTGDKPYRATRPATGDKPFRSARPAPAGKPYHSTRAGGARPTRSRDDKPSGPFRGPKKKR